MRIWIDIIIAISLLLAGTILLVILYSVIAPLVENPNDPKFGAKTVELFCIILPLSYAIPWIIGFVYERLISKHLSSKE